MDNHFIDYIKNNNIKVTGIMHFGAHYAEECAQYRNLYNVPVLWFEAHPAYAAKMMQALRPYPEQKGFEACMSNIDNQKVEFWTTADEYASSMLKPAYHQIQNPHALINGKIELNAVRFDTFAKTNLNEFDMSKFNVVILDVQGAEKMVWEGMGEYQKNVEILISEYSTNEFYENVPRLNDLDIAYANFTRIYPNDSQIAIHSDALYRRK